MWDVSITPKILFNNEKIVIEAPDTSHIKVCKKFSLNTSSWQA